MNVEILEVAILLCLPEQEGLSNHYHLIVQPYDLLFLYREYHSRLGLNLSFIKFSTSKQLPQIHRKEILRTDSAVSHDERRLRIEKFAELIQSVRPLLRIAFHFDGYHRTFLTQDEIHFIVPLTPIEHFKAMHKGLAY